MVTLPTIFEFEIKVINQAIEFVELIVQKNYKIFEKYHAELYKLISK